jgi:GAF domain-containing protein
MADVSKPQASTRGAVAAVANIEFVPTVLELLCKYTGLRWAAVAHVTETSWTACAVRDGLAFGIEPGGELKVEQTLCIEAKRRAEAIAISHASQDPRYAGHPVPKQYCFESYVSTPIVLPDGSYFGNLCALDPEPHEVTDPRTAAIFEAFASLIGAHLAVEAQRDQAQAALLARMRQDGKRR